MINKEIPAYKTVKQTKNNATILKPVAKNSKLAEIS